MLRFLACFGWALTYFLVAVAAAVVGFGGFADAGGARGIALFLSALFFLASLVAFILGWQVRKWRQDA